MKIKGVYLHAIIAGCILVVGTLFFVIAQRSMSNVPDGAAISKRDIAFMIVGTILLMAAMINFLIILIKLFKEKKLI